MSRVPTLTTEEDRVASQFDGTAADIATGDFNGDGLTDVVVTKMLFPFQQFSIDTEILLNDGQGGFINGTEQMLGGDQAWTTFGQEIEVADFNGDGVDDIFVADQGFIGDDGNLPGGSNLLLLSDGAGGMVNASAQSLPFFFDVSTSVTSGDVDGDGDIDLFVGNTWGNNRIPPYLLLNDGNGNFDYSNDRLPADVLDVDARQYTDTELADMDGDGDLDLIMGAGDQFRNPNLILLNDGDGNFDERVTLPTKPFGDYGIVQDMAVGDLNGDGRDDIVINYTDPSRQGNATQILLQTSTGQFVDATQTNWPTFVETGPPASKVTLVDLDDDADLDIALELEDTGVLFYTNNGTGSFTPRQLDLDGGGKFEIADLNGDRSPDIVSTVEVNGRSAEYQVQLNESWPSLVEGEDGGTNITVTDGNGSRVVAGDGDDTINGGPGGDTIDGGEGNDTLIGGGSDDSLSGAGGDDTLEGGAGADRLDGGDGFADTASYASSDQGVSIDLEGRTASGGDAAGDRLINIENVTGSNQNDTLTGDEDDNTLTGLDGDDTLTGGQGHDILNGGDGDDIIDAGDGTDEIEGGAGADTIDGGEGWDYASYGDSDAAVTVSLAEGRGQGGHAEGDTLTNIEEIRGSDFDDVLIGDDGANDLLGGDGDDTLQGGVDWDRLDGGAGLDTADYSDASEDLQINLDNDQGPGVEVAQPDGTDLLVSIEGLIGGRGDDRLSGDAEANFLAGSEGEDSLRGRGGDDTLQGGAGDDHLNGGSGNDTADFSDGSGAVVDLGADDPVGTATGLGTDTLRSIENVIGTSTDDALTGDNRANVLTGGDGEDLLEGKRGHDTLDGGDGNDELRGGDGNDTIIAGDGDDTVFGADDDDTITGGDGEDMIDGGAGSDDIDGGAEIDTIYGQDGHDLLQGGDGDDRLYGGRGSDVIHGGNDDDWIIGNQGADELFGGDGDDRLGGGIGNDTIDGGEGEDTLIGYHGNDILYGRQGDDSLNGGEGDDSLVGGEGADEFHFSRTSGGIDRIVDFSIDDGDLITITGAGVTSWSALQAAYTVTMASGDLRIEFDANNVLILEDIDQQDIDSSFFDTIV